MAKNSLGGWWQLDHDHDPTSTVSIGLRTSTFRRKIRERSQERYNLYKLLPLKNWLACNLYSSAFTSSSESSPFVVLSSAMFYFSLSNLGPRFLTCIISRGNYGKNENYISFDGRGEWVGDKRKSGLLSEFFLF